MKHLFILLQTLYQGINFGSLVQAVRSCFFELLVPMVIAGIVDQSLPQRNQGHLWMQIGLLPYLCSNWCL